MFKGTRLRDMPGRLATGAYILNSGLMKLSADEATVQGVHATAAAAYPFLNNVSPQMFVKGLSTAEITLGTMLLTPVVSTRVAGAALTGFAGGLIGLYLNAPGLRDEGSLRPTQEGSAIAKDSWLLGMGLGFLIDSLGRGKKK